MINNRQNGRRRGRGGGGSGGQRQGGNPGRPEMGNRIDNRARGNASQLHEKYKTLARDAQMQGDRVNTEYYLQFADHYFRVLAEQRGRFEDQNQRRPQNDSFDGDDEDYGDEGEPIRAEDQSGRSDRLDRGEPRNDRGENRDRDDSRGNRADNRDRGDDRGDVRNDRSRDERPRPEPRQRSESFESRQRGASSEERAPRTDRGEHDRHQRNGSESAPVSAPVTQADDAAASAGETPAEPRRRGRPRKVREDQPEPVAAFDADRLPPSLGISLSNGGTDAEADEEKPRRRRGRPAAEATPAS